MDQPQATAASPRFAPVFFAALWLAALEWYRIAPRIGVFGLVVVLVVTSWWAFQHRHRLVSRGSFWLGITVYGATSLGALSFVGLPLAQHFVIVATAVVAWLYLRQAVSHTSSELQGRTAVFVMAIAYFSGVVALLSLGIFVTQPWWVVISSGAVLYLLIAVIVWLDLEVPLVVFRRSLPWVFFLGAELMTVAWWLPTSIYVSAGLATTLGLLFVHLGRHVWRRTWEAARGRRYLAVGLSLVTIILLTARWN